MVIFYGYPCICEAECLFDSRVEAYLERIRKTGTSAAKSEEAVVIYQVMCRRHSPHGQVGFDCDLLLCVCGVYVCVYLSVQRGHTYLGSWVV